MYTTFDEPRVWGVYNNNNNNKNKNKNLFKIEEVESDRSTSELVYFLVRSPKSFDCDPVFFLRVCKMNFLSRRSII